MADLLLSASTRILHGHLHKLCSSISNERFRRNEVNRVLFISRRTGCLAMDGCSYIAGSLAGI